MKKPFESKLIAPCGMNCGICMAYLRKKNKCPCCREIDINKSVTRAKCKIKNCEIFQKDKSKFCFECNNYPCARIKHLDKRYRTKYEMSMIENLNLIKEKGIGKFIEKEMKRWKCPVCGEMICVHNKQCYNCGKVIPITGRIGRFAKILKKETNENTLVKIMRDSDKYESFNGTKKAAWWRDAMVRLENELGRDNAQETMLACGQKCCGETHRKLARQYWQESKNLKEFIDKLNNHIYRGQVSGMAGVRLKVEDTHTITGGYDQCYCGQVKHTKEPFPNDIYCHCAAGWLKMLFESAFEKPVNVEMIQSILNGADSCEFLINF